jgi:hypothetical protein
LDHILESAQRQQTGRAKREQWSVPRRETYACVSCVPYS